MKIRARVALFTSLSLALLCALSGCSNAVEEGDFVLSEALEDEKATFDSALDPGEAKEDSLSADRALPISVDQSATAVWKVKNFWGESDTPAAREAGLAWGADSGLDWDEKYALWVGSLKKIPAQNYGETFELTTPFGKTLPAPSLECAEASLFLRATFASWYQLPFFVEARDGKGERVFLGHFGFRTAEGKYANSANFSNYSDFSDRAERWREQGWPEDSRLRARRLGGAQDDEQPALFEGAHAGAYFDEIFLNKRTGYFMIYLLSYFGSVNLADSSNTFNIIPEATREGDTLLHRWKRQGIGHTMVVKRVEEIVEGRFEIELVSGSMPRRQPDWESASSSKYSLTAQKGGGHEVSFYDDVSYSRLGGGIKRWRTAQVMSGRWVNVVPAKDRDVYVSSTDYTAIGERVQRFEEVLTELSPELKREVILERLHSARQHLQRYPASCAARTRREEAFTELYNLEEEHFGVSREEIDERYRRLEDYVLAELTYDQSKTCCWNSTTSDMFEIIMAYAQKETYSDDEGMCAAPTVFKSYEDGYERWSSFAEELGLGELWVEWSEDEACAQRDVAEDKLSAQWDVKWFQHLCAE
jgi:hypothetical protein